MSAVSGQRFGQDQGKRGFDFEEIEGPGLAISVGLYDFDDPLEAFEIGLDYSFKAWRWGFVPHLGVHGTEDETYFVYAGLRRHFRLSEKWFVTGSLAASYHEPGDGKDLGYALEFRSGLSLSREFEGGSQLGLGFYHLSNSSLSSTNPGANSLLLRYKFPSRKEQGHASR